VSVNNEKQMISNRDFSTETERHWELVKKRAENVTHISGNHQHFDKDRNFLTAFCKSVDVKTERVMENTVIIHCCFYRGGSSYDELPVTSILPYRLYCICIHSFPNPFSMDSLPWCLNPVPGLPRSCIFDIFSLPPKGSFI
jgi:hypothetical protein